MSEKEEQLEKKVRDKITEIEQRRDNFVQQANQQVAGWQQQIRDLKEIIGEELPKEDADPHEEEDA